VLVSQRLPTMAPITRHMPVGDLQNFAVKARQQFVICQPLTSP
jgi:hypothetical protein